MSNVFGNFKNDVEPKLGKRCEHSALAQSCYICELEYRLTFTNAQLAVAREALEETHKLYKELRRTIDDGHWFASDLDTVGRLSESALAKIAFDETKSVKGD